jgi:glucose-1-phosphate adenylyltransferase
VLTARRSMAAVPFGGLYRVVDFVLTNLATSRIERVGILSQYRPASLMDHVGIGRPWDYNGRTRELSFLPPYQGTADVDWYRGTADAVYQNLHALRRARPRDVLIASGDHAYRMHYGPLIDAHRRSRSDLTMVFRSMDVGRPARFGVGVLGEGRRVAHYLEKPADPPSDLASLTIYVFRTEALVARIEENARTGRTFQLYDEVIPAMVAEDRVSGYLMRGPWEYLRPLSGYHEAHMRLVAGRQGVSTDGVLTNLEAQGVADAAPLRFEGEGRARRTLAAPGCVVAGRVERSVLFPRVRVEPDAQVRESVVLHGVTAGRGCRVSRAVVDKDASIGEGAVIEGGADLVSVGRAARIGTGARIGAGTVVQPGAVVPDGAILPPREVAP